MNTAVMATTTPIEYSYNDRYINQGAFDSRFPFAVF